MLYLLALLFCETQSISCMMIRACCIAQLNDVISPHMLITSPDLVYHMRKWIHISSKHQIFTQARHSCNKVIEVPRHVQGIICT